MKYIINIDKDKVFTDGQNKKLYKAKGFNSLVFDEEGLSKLEPITSDVAGYMTSEELQAIKDMAKKDGYDSGREDGYDKCKAELEVKVDKAVTEGYIKAIFECDWAIDRLLEFSTRELEEEFGTQYLADCLSKNSVHYIITTIKAYEEKKKAEEEIKVGDEVMIPDNAKDKFCVIRISENYVKIMDSMNEIYTLCKEDKLAKTGKHYDIESILKELGK